MMRHLVNTQYMIGLAGGETGGLFLSFGRQVSANRIRNGPLGRILTYKKNLIYLFSILLCQYISPNGQLYILPVQADALPPNSRYKIFFSTDRAGYLHSTS